MQEELLKALAQFHREVVLPDMKRVVNDTVDTTVGSLRHEMYSIADGMYVRFDRIESELASIKAGISRIVG